MTRILNTSEASKIGISRTQLARLADRGVLKRVARGVYVPKEPNITEHHSLAEVAARVPHGIVCLLSALRFHGLTTQNPHEVWLALGPTRRTPVPGYPSLRVIRMSGKSLSHGVMCRTIEGVPVRITSPAKTVVDCFKFRNTQVGLDVAIEALRDYVHAKLPMDALWEAARICRMQRVMRPYLEAIG